MARTLPTNPAKPPKHGPYATVRWDADQDPPQWVRTLTDEGRQIVTEYLAPYEPTPALVLFKVPIRRYQCLANKVFHSRRIDRWEVHQAARAGVANAVSLWQPGLSCLKTHATQHIYAEIVKRFYPHTYRKPRPRVGSLFEFVHYQHGKDGLIIADTVAAPPTAPPEVDWLPVVLQSLDRRSRTIVRLVLDGETYTAIGRRLRISKERVRQLWDEARRKILLYHPWLYELAIGSSPFRRGA